MKEDFHSWHRVRAGTVTRRAFREHAGRRRAIIERLLEQGTATLGILSTGGLAFWQGAARRETLG